MVRPRSVRRGQILSDTRILEDSYGFDRATIQMYYQTELYIHDRFVDQYGTQFYNDPNALQEFHNLQSKVLEQFSEVMQNRKTFIMTYRRKNNNQNPPEAMLPQYPIFHGMDPQTFKEIGLSPVKSQSINLSNTSQSSSNQLTPFTGQPRRMTYEESFLRRLSQQSQEDYDMLIAVMRQFEASQQDPQQTQLSIEDTPQGENNQLSDRDRELNRIGDLARNTQLNAAAMTMNARRDVSKLTEGMRNVNYTNIIDTERTYMLLLMRNWIQNTLGTSNPEFINTAVTNWTGTRTRENVEYRNNNLYKNFKVYMDAANEEFRRLYSDALNEENVDNLRDPFVRNEQDMSTIRQPGSMISPAEVLRFRRQEYIDSVNVFVRRAPLALWELDNTEMVQRMNQVERRMIQWDTDYRENLPVDHPLMRYSLHANPPDERTRRRLLMDKRRLEQESNEIYDEADRRRIRQRNDDVPVEVQATQDLVEEDMVPDNNESPIAETQLEINAGGSMVPETQLSAVPFETPPLAQLQPNPNIPPYVPPDTPDVTPLAQAQQSLSFNPPSLDTPLSANPQPIPDVDPIEEEDVPIEFQTQDNIRRMSEQPSANTPDVIPVPGEILARLQQEDIRLSQRQQIVRQAIGRMSQIQDQKKKGRSTQKKRPLRPPSTYDKEKARKFNDEDEEEPTKPDKGRANNDSPLNLQLQWTSGSSDDPYDASLVDSLNRDDSPNDFRDFETLHNAFYRNATVDRATSSTSSTGTYSFLSALRGEPPNDIINPPPAMDAPRPLFEPSLTPVFMQPRLAVYVNQVADGAPPPVPPPGGDDGPPEDGDDPVEPMNVDPDDENLLSLGEPQPQPQPQPPAQPQPPVVQPPQPPVQNAILERLQRRQRNLFYLSQEQEDIEQPMASKYGGDGSYSELQIHRVNPGAAKANVHRQIRDAFIQGNILSPCNRARERLGFPDRSKMVAQKIFNPRNSFNS